MRVNWVRPLTWMPFEDIEHLERAAGIPEIISCRYNPGGVFLS